jgi:hypothetical protein
MTRSKTLDQEIRTLQERLRDVWQQLGDPSLTAFSRRELRNLMKQYSAELRAQLTHAAELQATQNPAPARSFAKPNLRLLA